TWRRARPVRGRGSGAAAGRNLSLDRSALVHLLASLAPVGVPALPGRVAGSPSPFGTLHSLRTATRNITPQPVPQEWPKDGRWTHFRGVGLGRTTEAEVGQAGRDGNSAGGGKTPLDHVEGHRTGPLQRGVGTPPGAAHALVRPPGIDAVPGVSAVAQCHPDRLRRGRGGLDRHAGRRTAG